MPKRKIFKTFPIKLLVDVKTKRVIAPSFPDNLKQTLPVLHQLEKHTILMADRDQQMPPFKLADTVEEVEADLVVYSNTKKK